MGSKFKHIVISCSFLFNIGMSFCLNAQTPDSAIINYERHATVITEFSAEDYAKLVLPPLASLLETTLNSPGVGYVRARRAEEEGNLKTVKRSWMTAINFVGSYQYGILGMAATSTSNQTGVYVQYTGQKQSIYSTGASIALPLEVLYNRKNKIKTQEGRLKQVDYEIAQAIEERKTQIIETYVGAIKQLNILKIMSESVVLANSDMQLSQVHYLDGNISLSELSTVKTTQVAATSNYESTKSDLNKSILLLELLTNVNIINK